MLGAGSEPILWHNFFLLQNELHFTHLDLNNTFISKLSTDAKIVHVPYGIIFTQQLAFDMGARFYLIL